MKNNFQDDFINQQLHKHAKDAKNTINHHHSGGDINNNSVHALENKLGAITDTEKTTIDHSLAAKQSKQRVKHSAIKLLAMREHSRVELIQKLTRYHDLYVVEGVVDDLQRDDWQSDTRFALMWVRARANRGFGPQRIRQELKQKGVATNTIADALMQPDLDWFEIAQALYKKKYKSHRIQDWVDKSKRMKFMQYKGFTAQHYESVML